jgi:hypothetical protein
MERTGKELLYWRVLVCTGTYQYIPVRTILPDPVQTRMSFNLKARAGGPGAGTLALALTPTQHWQ